MVLGVADEMEIFHDLTGIFVEDDGKDLLWVLAAHEGAGIGCVLANIETSQHCLSGALTGGCFASGIVGWGGFFIRFYVGRVRGLFFSNILALYVQGGYTLRATRWCCFRDEQCHGLGRRNIRGPLWWRYSWTVYPASKPLCEVL